MLSLGLILSSTAGNRGGSLNNEQHDRSGFSLVEILTVLFIVALLAGLTWPSYQAAVLDAGRAEAKATLLMVTSEQEHYFSNFNRYVNDASPLDAPATAGRRKLTSSGRYSVSVEACESSSLAFCFVATATPLGSQINDVCTSLSIDSTGRRSAAGSLSYADDCWNY
jgi:type IV pilus assembly protein PilE